MKGKETLDPVDISLFRAQTEVAVADALAELVDEFWRLWVCDGIHYPIRPI
jgi:hypothetical protein